MKRWIMIHKIKALYDEGNGYSIKQISKELSISRNCVRRYLRMTEDDINKLQVTNHVRTKALDVHRDYIVHLLQKYPKLTSNKIVRKLEAKGVAAPVSERSFRRYVKDLKDSITTMQPRYYEPVIDMVPGAQIQVDMGELRNVLIEGEPTTVYFIVFVLSYSRMMYVSLSNKPVNTDTFIKLHDEAFSFFGGIVDECVYDQTKLVAIKEEFREVWFNEEFYRYATLAGFDIRVCRGYDPESKGKVEAGVKYVKNDFFYGDDFLSLAALKEDLLTWLTTVANVRIHGTTKKVPRQCYVSEEKDNMKPYLRPDFLLTNHGEKRLVDKTSLISYKSNKYSVPMKYQSSTVFVKEDETRLVIKDIDSFQTIATHDIHEAKGKIIKNNNHYRDYEKRISESEGEVCSLIGKDLAERLCKVIKITSPKIYKDQLAGLLHVLKCHLKHEGFEKPLGVLAERPRLKVSFIRDYLSAYYLNKGTGRAVTANRDDANSHEAGDLLSVYKSIARMN